MTRAWFKQRTTKSGEPGKEEETAGNRLAVHRTAPAVMTREAPLPLEPCRAVAAAFRTVLAARPGTSD